MTDTEMVEGVPTKIVMVGTSTMTLHQRFSRLPKPKLLPSKPIVERAAPIRGSPRARIRGHTIAARRANALKSQPVYEVLDPLDVDFVEEYVPVAPRVRRLQPVFRRPIEERLTIPPRPQVVYVPVPVPRKSGRVVGSRGIRGRGGIQRNQGQKNNVRGILNSPNFKNRSVGLVSRGGRGGGRGRFAAGRGRYTTEPKKSISELDRELEEYMKKSKHPKIIV